MSSDSRSKPMATSFRVSAERELALDRPRLMAVVNVTPDSFSDGGRYPRPADAVDFALHMVAQGAEILDIGGESTRPGARRIPVIEQTRRVLPVVRGVRARSDVLISVDTTRADVARRALDGGADIINDVSAGAEDEAMLPLAAERGCGLVLMHRLRAPDADQYSDRYDQPPVYDDVVMTVRDFLVRRAEAARQAGVDRRSIVIDPGLGFGKTVEQNYELIRRADALLSTGYAVLSAASRKSFVGQASGVTEPQRRVAGSVAISVSQYLAGVRLFRVHDVAAHRQALAVAAAILGRDRPARSGGPSKPAHE